MAEPASGFVPEEPRPALAPEEQAPTSTLDGHRKLVVVHVRPGSEYQALMYLLRHVNRHFSMDDVLPDPPDDIIDHRYKILAWPADGNPSGDAGSNFLHHSYPGGLLLQRVRVRARETWELHAGRDDDLLRRQRMMPTSLLDSPSRICHQIKAIRRQMTTKRQFRCFEKMQMVPVAMPADMAYLQMAAEAIMKFNSLGLVLTVFLDDTCRAVAAALRVQAAWRSAMFRAHNLPLTLQIQRFRAAVVIQKAWRAYLYQRRFHMLGEIKRLVGCMNNLLLGGKMTLDVRSSQLLRNRMAHRQHLYPEHALRFAFDRFRKVHVVVPASDVRGGLPRWLGAGISTMSATELQAAHGTLPLYGQQDALQLLMNGAEWEDPQGRPCPISDCLPEPETQAQPSDCILQIKYKDIVEARSRACLMLALTYDPKFDQGVALVPPHFSSLARLYSPMTPNLSGLNSADMQLLRWASLRATLATSSQPQSPLPSRHHSPMREPSPCARVAASASRDASPLPSPTRGGSGILFQDVPSSRSQMARDARSPSPGGRRASVSPLAGMARRGGSGQGMSTSRSTTPTRKNSLGNGEQLISPLGSPRRQSPLKSRLGSPQRLPSPPLRFRASLEGPVQRLELEPCSSVPRLPALDGPRPCSTNERLSTRLGSPLRLPPRPFTQASESTSAFLLPPIAGALDSRPQARLSLPQADGPPLTPSRSSLRPRSSLAIDAQALDISSERLEGMQVSPWTSADSVQGPGPGPGPRSGQQAPSPQPGTQPAAEKQPSLRVPSQRSSPLPDTASLSAQSSSVSSSPTSSRVGSPNQRQRGTTAPVSALPLYPDHLPVPLATWPAGSKAADTSGLPSADLLARWNTPPRATPPPSTPASRLLASLKLAEAYANDPSHLVLLPQGLGSLHSISEYISEYMDLGWSTQEGRDEFIRWMGENPELHVERASLLPFMREDDMLTGAVNQATLLRYQSHLHDAFIAAQRAELQYQRASRAHAAASQPVFEGRPTATGHILAPGYVPLSSSEMGDLVAAMTDVYRAAAVQVVTKTKQDHSEVMREIREEREHMQHVISASHNRQTEVAATMQALYSDAWDKAKRARVNQRLVRNARKQRQAHDRSFAQAFVRQTNLLTKNVREGELSALTGYHSAVRRDATAVLKQEQQQTAANIQLGREDLLELNRWKALDVKRNGYTKELQEYDERAEKVARDVVSLRRRDEVERLQRVGPAGGAGKAAASLRTPLPLSTVVSAAHAKQQRQRAAAASAASLRGAASAPSTRGAAAAAAAGAGVAMEPSHLQHTPRSARTEGSSEAPYGGAASDAALAAGSAWPDNEDDEGGDILPDFLPELPYARGAVLTISQRDKPIGIIV